MYKTYPENRGQLKDRESIHRYIHGGRGIVTLEAPSGNSHSYMFARPVNKSTFPDDVLFVYAAHNNEKLFYLGMMEGESFRLTKHSRFLEDTEIVRGAKYIVSMSKSLTLAENTPMKLYHEGMCARCGRPLTSEKSIEHGMGSKCKGLNK